MYFNLLMYKDYYYYYYYYYLTGFAKTWLKKFQVHSNKLTSKWNGKQLKVTSCGKTMSALSLAIDGKVLLQKYQDFVMK